MKKEYVIFFCESYILVENALYIINFYKESNIHIIVYSFELNLLFNEIVDKKHITNVKITYFVKRREENLIQTVYNVNSFFINSLKNKVKDFTIIFSTQFFAPDTAFFIKKLRKKSKKVIFLSPKNYTETIPTKFEKFSWKNAAKTILNKLFFNWNLSVKKMHGREVIFLSNDYVKRVSDIYISNLERKKLVNSTFLFNSYTIINSHFKVVFFDTPFQRDGIEPSSLLDSEMESIFNDILTKYKHDEIAIKLHPGERSLISDIEKYGIIIPSYIPGEFLSYMEIDFAITFWSTTIFDNNSKMNISLNNMVTFLPSDLRRARNSYLLNRTKKNILFPVSHNQFKKILSE